jgi:hypothetical protein
LQPDGTEEEFCSWEKEEKIKIRTKKKDRDCNLPQLTKWQPPKQRNRPLIS